MIKLRRTGYSLVVILALLTMPAAAAAKHSKSTEKAEEECKAELAVAGLENFRALYGSGKNRVRATRHCIRAHKNFKHHIKRRTYWHAAKKCKDEQATDPDRFEQEYNSEGTTTDAFNNCVAKYLLERASEEKHPFSDRLLAIESCRDERAADEGAFLEKYRKIGDRLRAKLSLIKKPWAKKLLRHLKNRPFAICVRTEVKKIRHGDRDQDESDDSGEKPDSEDGTDTGDESEEDGENDGDKDEDEDENRMEGGY